jgi:hypothetical protein
VTTTIQRANPSKWLLLIHQIPAKPDYLRVKIRRRLGQLGAVALKNSVYVLPATPGSHAALSELARDILRQGGEAVVCESRLIEGLTDGAVEDLLRAAHGREFAAGLLSLVEDLVQGVEEHGERKTAASEQPRGATWVTRTGVMVDRIASAWLIRRFIDPSARFKFVNGRGYRSRPGELRFDMAGAEFTHQDDHCTFEVLVEQFRLRDSALKPIAEIVHDLDLEDDTFQRPEAAGVDRMIVGRASRQTGRRDTPRRGRGGVRESLRVVPQAGALVGAPGN